MTVTFLRPFELELNRPKSGEFTYYLDPDKFRLALWRAIRTATDQELVPEPIVKARSFDFLGPITFGNDRNNPRVARGHGALCFANSGFSLTVREELKSKVPDYRTETFYEQEEVQALPRCEDYSSYNVLYDSLKIRPSSTSVPPTGLLLITGGTGSSKTGHLNAILHSYLRHYLDVNVERHREVSRLPHVVIMGDPVETLLYSRKNADLISCYKAQTQGFETRPIDFTARLIGTDIMTVQEGLEDALRETPTVVVVSELRSQRDIRSALKFAESGHLLLSTAHSGSLVETFAKLLECMDDESTAGTRAALVKRLAAVVHLQAIGTKYKVPALWRSNPRGQQDFISEGLSSLIPRNPAANSTDTDHGVLGRYWMLGEIRKKELIREKELKDKAPGEVFRKYIEAKVPDDQFKVLQRRAFELDLHGDSTTFYPKSKTVTA